MTLFVNCKVGYDRGLQVALLHRQVGWTSNHRSLDMSVAGPGEAVRVSCGADRY